MVLLSELSGTLSPKVTLIGSWADKMAGFSEAVQSMATQAEVQIIVLHAKDAVGDYVFPQGWHGAWIGIKPYGYIMACVSSCSLSSGDVSSKLKDLVEKKWKKPCPVALTVDDPFSTLSGVKPDDEMMKDVVEKKDQIQFVDMSKKCPRASDEMPVPAKSSRIVITSPGLDVPMLLGARMSSQRWATRVDR